MPPSRSQPEEIPVGIHSPVPAAGKKPPVTSDPPAGGRPYPHPDPRTFSPAARLPSLSGTADDRQQVWRAGGVFV